MDILGIPVVLVPPNPGNVSAYGLLTVDVRNDYVRTAVAADQGLKLESLGQMYDALTDQAREALERQGFAIPSQVIERSADLRYLGQAFEVRVACPDGDITRQWADHVVDGFHDAHQALYGYDFRGKVDQAVEWVNLRATGVGPIPRPTIHQIATRSGNVQMTAIGTRPMHCEEWLDATIYDRARLAAGDTIRGPAVVQEFGSTVPVFPGFQAAVDAFGNLLMTRSEGP
jgi:N-methylhydantoinase A